MSECLGRFFHPLFTDPWCLQLLEDDSNHNEESTTKASGANGIPFSSQCWREDTQICHYNLYYWTSLIVKIVACHFCLHLRWIFPPRGRLKVKFSGFFHETRCDGTLRGHLKINQGGSVVSSSKNGRAWFVAGTWEEKNVNKWATDRIKELLVSVASVDFPGGNAQISDVSKCVGDATLVTVRNKKRVGYTYELTLKFTGEWSKEEKKTMLKGQIDIPEFSFGELDDLEMEVRLTEAKDLLHQDKSQISKYLKLFLQPVREKLLQFEQELKDR